MMEIDPTPPLPNPIHVCALRLNGDEDFAFEKKYPREMPHDVLAGEMVSEMSYFHPEEVEFWRKELGDQSWDFDTSKAIDLEALLSGKDGGGEEKMDEEDTDFNHK